MSNEQAHDPTVTLRLELGRVTDQRDAFKAALNTELLKVAKVAIYQAMLDADSKAADTIGCMGVEVDDLRKENARLKAEVERLTKQNALATPRHLIASQDIKTLREQIEELKLENSQYEEHHKYGQNVITSLRAEVERLSQPAVIGGYNLSQYVRMANSETLEFDNGDIFADMTLPERIKYIVESHASLKVEVENFNEYLKWHADGHKFAAWQVWRSQQSDGGQDKEVQS